MFERILAPLARLTLALLPLVLACGSTALAQQAPSPPQSPQSPQSPSLSRGQMLYETHCVACHTTQMHWRNDRQAYDWTSLSVQVRRWQGNAGLQWTDADVLEVTRYLNETIYKFPQSDGRVASVGMAARLSCPGRLPAPGG